MPCGISWYRVDVETVTTVRKVGSSEVVGKTKEIERLKAYTWEQAGKAEAKEED